jgi:signal transduction histidine kinase
MTSSSKAIVACALLIVICVGTLSFWSEVWNEKDREWVTHTLLVVEKLQAIRIDITQAETGHRGYMLTGQDRYLELYRAGADQVRQDMKELPDLIVDDPRERKATQRLEPLIAARLAELADGIEVRRQSGLPAGVEAVARANNGEKWMGQIAAQIGEMRATQELLLSRRQETAAASTRKIKVVIVLGNALAVLILLVKGFVIHWETGMRNLAEQDLKQANERLEGRTSELETRTAELLASNKKLENRTAELLASNNKLENRTAESLASNGKLENRTAELLASNSKLENRTAELLEANVEMESFAYSVAHDLRAPLRHIAGYSNVLTQDYGPQLGGEGRRYLGKLVDGAQRMGRLVDDLLNLSKIGRQELALEATPLELLVRQAVEELAPEGPGREIEWRIGDLFIAKCDPGLMRQVFVNLLSNAVKYSGKREHAVIEVGQVMQNGERVVFVRDNGVGFEMQYAGKLFGVFQRLHKAGDFEGTGVGLAIVQRIIRKHGGRIWAEAELDKGATFFFTLGTPEINPATEPTLTSKEKAMHV